MTSRWTVSPALPADYPAFARLLPELGVPDPTPSADRFARTIARDALVVRDGDEILGYLWARPRGDRLHVVHVITDPAHRGRGVGRALMLAIAEPARAAGFRRWMLNVKPENVAARALYERCGMRVAFASVAMHLVWTDVERMEVPTGIVALSLAPADDARFEDALALLRGEVASQRALEGRVLLGAEGAGPSGSPRSIRTTPAQGSFAYALRSMRAPCSTGFARTPSPPTTTSTCSSRAIRRSKRRWRRRGPPCSCPCCAWKGRSRPAMTKGRLEAFSDGVLAVIITIMVLELKVPHGEDLRALNDLVPDFLAYVLSFIYVGIYWNDHHHLLHATRHISGSVMWANLHLLFWLSLVPASTGWVGAHPSAPWPTALYGAVLLMAALAWLVLEKRIIAVNGKESELAQAVRHGAKENASPVLYTTAIGLAFVRPWIADMLYAVVALLWIVPDRRIESKIRGEGS